MMNRCLNHIFGYCYSKPQPVETEDTQTDFTYRGKPTQRTIMVTRCLNDHRNCSQYVTHSMLCELATK